MAYTEESHEMAVVPNGSTVLAPDDLSSAAVHGEYLFMTRTKVKRLLALVTTVTVGDATIAYKRRPTPGSATGEVTLGSVTIPGGSAVGQTLFKDIDPVYLNAGEALAFEITSAATSGAAVYGTKMDDAPEDARENTKLVESA